jgi:hypothetical protein
MTTKAFSVIVSRVTDECLPARRFAKIPHIRGDNLEGCRDPGSHNGKLKPVAGPCISTCVGVGPICDQRLTVDGDDPIARPQSGFADRAIGNDISQGSVMPITDQPLTYRYKVHRGVYVHARTDRIIDSGPDRIWENAL